MEQRLIEEIRAGNNPNLLKEQIRKARQIEELKKEGKLNNQQITILKKRQEFDKFLEENFKTEEDAQKYF